GRPPLLLLHLVGGAAARRGGERRGLSRSPGRAGAGEGRRDIWSRAAELRM
ncbi:MAG: hypothetical protein AVDCRST_MAG13-3665, partial [uncultured Solirubrobacteraceae bacterium]